MLRVTQQTNAAAAKKYYSAADYLSEGQEIVGHWGGLGAERLGLGGVVDQHAFDLLCENRDPRTGTALTVRTRADRTVGYDFTWSAPKSVSVLYALSGDQDILAAFRTAVDETMRDIEADMQARVRKGRSDADRRTGNMVWSEFVHTTARPVDGVPDPQLHAHCFAFNATWDEHEARMKAGQFRGLKADAPYYQAAFRVRLANKLQELGFAVERKRDDFELAGMPAAVLKQFSRRTQEIEEKAEELGITDPKRKGELGAQTREGKSKSLGWTALRKEWDSRLTQPEREAVASVHRREAKAARTAGMEGPAVDHALAHVFVRKSVAGERELLTEAMKRGLGAVTVDGVRREFDRRSLVRGEVDGRAVVTTAALQAEERALVAIARDGRGRYRPLGDADRPMTRDWLNEGQKAAVRHVLGSRDFVTVVRGAAGTGKTTLEQELGEALAEAGMSVVAIAPSAGASRGVLREEANFPTADTVARFLKDPKMQVAGGVVLLDEASLLGSADMLAVFRQVKELGGRLVVLGDKRQHRSVARGQPLKLLEEKAGLPVAEVSQILRQTGSYQKAAKALSEGRVVDGFAELDRLGWIRELPDGERYQALADAYLAATAEKKRGGKNKTALVITATHAEANQIAGAVRETLKAAGKLGAERTLASWIPAHLTAAQKADAANFQPGDLLAFHQHAPGIRAGTRRVLGEGEAPPVEYADRFEVYRPSTVRLAAGDRVRVTANGRAKGGQRLNNGALYSVKGLSPTGDVVLDNGAVVPAAGGVHLAQGYAVTSPSGQGKTVDKVIAGLSSQSFPATTQRTAYVALTRGKEQALVFTDDKAELLRVMRRADDPPSALDVRRRRHPLRERLKKHLAHLRRQFTLGPTYKPLARERDRMHPLKREMGRER